MGLNPQHEIIIHIVQNVPFKIQVGSNGDLSFFNGTVRRKTLDTKI